MKISIQCFLNKPKKGSKYWAVEIPCLGVHTQGTSKNDAYAMARDAVGVLFESIKMSAIEVSDERDEGCLITLPANKEVFSKFLRASRISHNLTIMDMAKRLNSKSPTSYARYESGKIMPSMEKFSEILQALDKRLTPKLVVGG